MLRHLIYFKLQLKSALLCIPKLIAGTLLFSCIAVLIGYAGSKTLYHNDSLFYFRVAAVLPENDPLVNIGFNMLTGMNSLKDYCEFIRTDEDNAKELLERGEVYGIVYIPQGFVEDIMNGKNTPAQILLSGSSGIETALFRSVLNAGSNTLAYVQSGIYALYDTYSRFGVSSLIADA
ncbi:MAG: ABC transporter permease, partial [Lachnospiraceae bacterium]